MFEKITTGDLAGKGVIGLPDVPGLPTEQMQAKFEETAREVIVPKFNALVDELSGPGAASVGAVGPDGAKTTIQAELGVLHEKAEQAQQIGTAAGESAQEAKRAAEEAMEEAKAKAPENHASIKEDYGIGDTGRFGHLKLSDSLVNAVAGNGVAASQKAVNAVYEYAKTLNDKVGAAVRYTPQALTLAQKAQARENIGAVSMDEISVATPDWSESDPRAKSYIKNRTHWVDESSKDGVLLAETTVEFRMEMASVSGIGTDGIKKGGKYLVDWNGTRYDCKAYELAGSVCLGNAALLGGENDTGEPFAIEAIMADGCTLVKNTSTAESVTLAVTGVENTVWHQLDPRFIPDMYYSEGGGGGEVILPETQATFLEVSTFTIQNAIDGVTVGEKYTVGYNGVEYETVAVEQAVDEIPVTVLGNTSALDGGPGTGEPFIVMIIPADLAVDTGFGVIISPLDGATTVTVSITSGSGETIHKLDNKYLDLEWLPVQKKTLLVAKTVVENSGFLDGFGYEVANAGTKVMVVVDGVNYPVAVKVIGSGLDAQTCAGNIAVGNSAFAGTEFDTGEPFLALLYNGRARFTFADGASHKVAVYSIEPNKMPAEFLPEPVIVDGSAMTLVTGEDLTIPLADAFGAAAFVKVIEQLRNGVRVGLTISFQPKTSAGTGDVSAYTMMFSGSTYNGRLQWSGTYIDGSAVHEINVQVNPATGMLYAMAREVTGSGAGSGSLPEGFDPLAVVSTKAQSFTPEQQAQARTNIGAASKEEAANASNAANSAGEKAVAAENAAAAAKSTAETAATAADEARTEAGEAVQTAAEAKETAEQAKNTAVSAAGIADEANADAKTAVSTANTAAGKANQATQQASVAKSTADQAIKDAAAAKSSAEAAEDSAASALAVANQKAPKSHLSETGEYGAATNRMYGHVMLSDDIHNDQVQGTAASTAGVSRAIRGMLVYNPQQLPEEYKAQARENIGAGEPADWSAGEDETGYIKNRTHWAEFSGEEIIAEKTMEYPTTSNGLYDISGNYAKIVNGSKCVVTWDGVKYNCVAGLRGETVYFGNMGALDSNFSLTGEPFCAYKTADRTMVVVAVDKAENTSETHTYKLYLDATTYHTLDPNYLPDTVLKTTAQALTEDQQAQVRANIGAAVAGETGIGAQSDWNAAEGEEGYVRNRTHWRDMVLGETILPATAVTVTGTMGEITGIGTNDFVEGGSYTVTWDGTDYTCICQNYNGLLLGNASMYGAGENTGEPFVFDIFDTDEIGVQVEGHTTDPATTHTVIIRENQMVYHKLPEEYLPESVDGVVIRSSTEGSTKKFRLTVDDSGIITATEV